MTQRAAAAAAADPSTLRSFKSIWMAMAVAATASSPASAAAAGASGRALLLSPHIVVGQTYSWRGDLQSHTDVFQCSANSEYHQTYAIARRVKVYLHRGPIPVLTDAAKKILASIGFDIWRPQAFPIIEPKPPILIRAGHEFAIDGSGLMDDPICLIYSASMYGEPPKEISVGTTWHYHQPPRFRFGCSRWPPERPGGEPTIDCRSAPDWIAVTITELNADTGVVGLRIAVTHPNDSTVNEWHDVIVKAGGIIARDTVRYSDEIDRWTLVIP